MMRNDFEHEHQKNLIAWWSLACHSFGVQEALLFAIPNGGARTAVTGARLKAEGVRAGVPDLFLAVARGDAHGLWIEMKTPTGRVQQSQSSMIRLLGEQGYRCVVCRGWGAARMAIEEYLSQRTL